MSVINLSVPLKTFSKSDTYDILDDVQRVETACVELRDKIKEMLRIEVALNVKTNWTRQDFPTVSEMERIRMNVEKLAKTLEESYSIQPFGNEFDYKIANSLEDGLRFTLSYLQNLIDILVQPRAGLYYAGQPLFLINRKEG